MTRLQQTKRVLGSDAVITIVNEDRVINQQIFETLWAAIAEFEARFSRFKADSELSQFNERAGQMVPVSTAFRDLLRTAKGMAERTDGLYNPLILPALQRAGYVGSWPAVHTFDDQLNHSERILASADTIRLTAESALIPANTALDFGGIGKGYLLDQLATLLAESEIVNYWISLGGDILASGHDSNNQSWSIGIEAADELGAICASAVISGRQAVATSGITKRRGADWHHLIDPRTGKPAVTDILTATVVSSTATEADIFAKCLVILGSEKAIEFIHQHQTTAVLIQTNSNRIIKLGSIWSN